jgi:hypothetical protein
LRAVPSTLYRVVMQSEAGRSGMVTRLGQVHHASKCRRGSLDLIQRIAHERALWTYSFLSYRVIVGVVVAQVRAAVSYRKLLPSRSYFDANLMEARKGLDNLTVV